VAAAVDFARREGALASIRGGGHNAGGLGVCDDGLVIDLSPMRDIDVDPDAGTVRVQGGATWGEVDRATHQHGLAVPSGIISTTGVGGLTLGGGIGHLSRRHGLAIDNLLAADVVLADGSAVTASEDENQDLFWALRGGGGNFGAVTSFLFRGNPVDTVLAGPMFWPLDQAEEVLRFYDELIADVPRDVNGFFAFLTVPPGDPFPAELHLRKVCGVVWCCTGDLEEAEEAMRPAREFGPPLLDGVQKMPFPDMQSAFDEVYPPGLQWYWRADFVDELPDEAIDAFVEAAGPDSGSPLLLAELRHLGGALARPAENGGALNKLDGEFVMLGIGMLMDPALKDPIQAQLDKLVDVMQPWAAEGGYYNYAERPCDIDAILPEETCRRLSQVKRSWDPDELIRANHSVALATA
jgi:hypothetical protein